MSKSVTFTVDADVYEKFCIALNLTNETKDAAVESCMRWYIAKTLKRHHKPITQNCSKTE